MFVELSAPTASPTHPLRAEQGTPLGTNAWAANPHPQTTPQPSGGTPTSHPMRLLSTGLAAAAVKAGAQGARMWGQEQAESQVKA